MLQLGSLGLTLVSPDSCLDIKTSHFPYLWTHYCLYLCEPKTVAGTPGIPSLLTLLQMFLLGSTFPSSFFTPAVYYLVPGVPHAAHRSPSTTTYLRTW